MPNFENEVDKAIAEGEMNRFDSKVIYALNVIKACGDIWGCVKECCEMYNVKLDDVAEFFMSVQDEMCEEMELDGEAVEDEDGGCNDDSVTVDDCDDECCWLGPCYKVDTGCGGCRNYGAETKECKCKDRTKHIKKWGEKEG